ncbi:MAG TPA: ribonuclease HI family protein [Desulfurivibrionaceae bacterium]|nr:ribonuclease HI family protein [Desulfurivibrionaceae bacterium]
MPAHPKPTTAPPRAVVERLAAALSDAVLRDLFPQDDPAAIRALLQESALRLPDMPPPVPAAPSALKQANGTITLYCDGASRGNPGEAAAGFVILDTHGAELAAKGIYLGQCTNNMAEYQALLLGLHEAHQLKVDKLTIRLDSELVVRQLEGRYQVKDAKLKPLYTKALSLLRGFESHSIHHVPRRENQRADELANQALDARQR